MVSLVVKRSLARRIYDNISEIGLNLYIRCIRRIVRQLISILGVVEISVFGFFVILSSIRFGL